jgi:Transposase IS116/IS110/IS902 family
LVGPRPQANLNRGPQILGKISKRGNRYLRVLFVQAAWVVLIKPKIWERHGLKHWIEAAKKRLHPNVLAIALIRRDAASVGHLALKFSSQKGVDFCGEESVTVAVTREAFGLIRDPAPLAMMPLRGFGGDGAWCRRNRKRI